MLLFVAALATCDLHETDIDKLLALRTRPTMLHFNQHQTPRRSGGEEDEQDE